jgi:thiamine pyrophosphokinase
MRAVVVAGAELDPADAALLDGADLVVAADAGARTLEHLGSRLDVLVGDLDSIDPESVGRIRADGARVEQHPTDKDASDTELAIEEAAASGADRIEILAALGGSRLDHELATLLLLADPAWGDRDLRIVRGGITVRALHAGERLDLVGRIGDMVSLLPVGGDAHGVRTQGLRWPLTGETLRMGRSRGLSNQIVAAPASVELGSGTLLLVETADGGT